MSARVERIIREIRDKLSDLERGARPWRADIVGDVRGCLNRLTAELQAGPVVATLEARAAPDLAKEVLAWLDNNVMRCGHGTIGVTCHICTTENLARYLPR